MNIEELQWRPNSTPHRSGRDSGRWGMISPSQAKYLVVNNTYGAAKMSLSPESTVRSVSLTLIEVFEKLEFARFPTSRVCTTILLHFRRQHYRLLIVDGVQHLGGVDEGKLRRSTEIRDLLKSLLLHGTPFMCIGPERGARFLLEDEQLWRRYRGSATCRKPSITNPACLKDSVSGILLSHE